MRAGGNRRAVTVGSLAAFVLAFAGSLVLHRESALHDTDSYYHLAVARTYAQEGMVHELPQVRRSLMREGFGDKELLFHLLLAPLAGRLDPLVAGRLGLALAGALAAAVVAAFAVRALGLWGLAVPFWLFYSSTELSWRVVRLRPELLSLVLLLAAVAAIGLGRDRWLAPVAFLYTWSYTAFQSLLGLAVLCFAYFSWTERRARWPLLLYTVAGIGLALVAHPHFPKNLEVWVVQNLMFFLRKGELDVGTEIRPNFSDVVLMVNLGWFMGLAVLGMAARREALEAGTDRSLAEALGIATLAFATLYLLMSRFSLYFIPFATLWWIYELRRRGRRPGAWMALPVRGRIPTALAVGVCLLASFPEAARQLVQYRTRTALGDNGERINDREALSDAIPPGARVAADWGPTATLMLWAPQGRYLNVLDPVFMATPYPEAHRRLMDVLTGREPDVPAMTATVLESDYLLYRSIGRRRLDLRLGGDPRVETLHRGAQTLVRFVPAQGSFVLDWRVVPEGVKPFEPGVRVEDWPYYPRLSDTRGRSLEAYVDAERTAPDAVCSSLARELVPEEATRLDVELAPYGPTSVWLDGSPALEIRDELGGILLRGVRLPLVLGSGRHRLTVVTCEGASADQKGFFWREHEVR